MITAAFKNDNMTVKMCMCMYMCFVALLSDRLSGQGKRRCTAE